MSDELDQLLRNLHLRSISEILDETLGSLAGVSATDGCKQAARIGRHNSRV